jgi:hypothetical protein
MARYILPELRCDYGALAPHVSDEHIAFALDEGLIAPSTSSPSPGRTLVH